MGTPRIEPSRSKLAALLESCRPTQLGVVAANAGVSPVAARRARKPGAGDTSSFVLLCAALGIDGLSGEPTPPSPRPGCTFSFLQFGIVLFFARSQAGRSIRAFAPLVELSTATVSRAESGKPVCVETVITVCRYVRMPPAVFLCFTGNQHCNSQSNNEISRGRPEEKPDRRTRP